MKTYNFLILFWLMVFIAIWLAFSSCTEIIYEEVEVPGDSIPYPVYVDRPTFIQTSTEKECVSTDTLDVHIELGNIEKNGEITKDTLISVSTACYALLKIHGYTLVPNTVRDSIVYKDRVVYIDRIVYDTIKEVRVEQRVIYKDTLYVLVETRQVFYVPDELLPYVSDFYTLAGQYGNEVLGGMLLITYAKEEDLPGEGWTSYSFRHGWDYSQMIIQISEKVPSEHARSCIFRELARLQLKKKYTNVPDRIMNPLFPPEAVITTSHLNQLFQ